jgi:hypothetical protein
MSPQYQYCSRASRLSIRRRTSDDALDHIAGHARDLGAVSLLPFPMESAMDFRFGTIVPASLLENSGKVPGLEDRRDAQENFWLDLLGQDVPVKADRSFLEDLAGPFTQRLFIGEIPFRTFPSVFRDPVSDFSSASRDPVIYITLFDTWMISAGSR